MNTTKYIIISHAECNDGTMAAAILQEGFGVNDNDVYFMKHGNVDSDLESKGVYAKCEEYAVNDKPLKLLVVDFSLPREVLIKLLALNTNLSITVIDHHASAKIAFDGYKDDPVIEQAMEDGRYQFLFDNNYSGCMLALAYRLAAIHPEHRPGIKSCVTNIDAFYNYLEDPEWRKSLELTRPHLLYVEDRDLWKWKYPQSKAFTEVLIAKAHTLPEIRRLFPLGDTNTIKVNVAKYVAQGEAILEYQNSLVDQLVKQAETCSIVIDGARAYGAMVNAIKQFSSDLGNKLSSICPHFALIYRVDGDRVEFSVRSQSNFNSRVISEYFGGGGHNQASGFKIPLEKMYETLSKLKYGEYEINTKG